MIESTVTVKGQTTLPKAVRESLAVKAGDKVRYVIVDKGALIMPVRPTDELFRSLEYDGPPVSLEDMDRAIAEGAAARMARSAPAAGDDVDGTTFDVAPDAEPITSEDVYAALEE